MVFQFIYLSKKNYLKIKEVNNMKYFAFGSVFGIVTCLTVEYLRILKEREIKWS